MHKRFYGELRERFGLAAQPTVENSPVVFRSEAAQPFDARCLSWQLRDGGGREGWVSIWTTAGRLKNLRIIGHSEHLALLRSQSKIGETDLICRDGVWMLHAVIEVPETPEQSPVNGFLGVDLGIANIATTSDGVRMSGARRRKEARFATDVNHQVSKSIVAEAERTGRGIAVEDLTGIRERVRLRKRQRATLHTWAFAQLGKFLSYKARHAGVVIVRVDPAYTSQRCHRCGWIDNKNRRSQASFICGRCGFVGHADHNAAHNIAQRGVVCWGEVVRPYAAPILAAS